MLLYINQAVVSGKFQKTFAKKFDAMCFCLIFALPFKNGTADSVAQLVEQYTFNVWALGSSPSGITKTPLNIQRRFSFIPKENKLIE